MIQQYYPGKFSPAARAAIEGELIRAGRAHDQRKRDWRTDFKFPLEKSLQTYILNVFLVYAREAIELGKKGVWTVDQVRSQALEGLRLIAIEIGSRKNYSFIEQNGTSIRRETLQEFEGTTEWREYEDELLALADSKRQSSPEPFEINVSAQPLGGESVGEANQGQSNGSEQTKEKTILASNLDRLRRDCGWSFEILSEKTGLEKKLILGHVNEGKPAQVRTLKTYADTFTKALNRPVRVAELESNLTNNTDVPPA